MIEGHPAFLHLVLCTSFQRGEGRTGHVRSGWSHTRFYLPFTVFMTCIIAPHCYRVYSIQRSCNKLCTYRLISQFCD